MDLIQGKVLAKLQSLRFSRRDWNRTSTLLHSRAIDNTSLSSISIFERYEAVHFDRPITRLRCTDDLDLWQIKIHFNNIRNGVQKFVERADGRGDERKIKTKIVLQLQRRGGRLFHKSKLHQPILNPVEVIDQINSAWPSLGLMGIMEVSGVPLNCEETPEQLCVGLQ